VVRTKILIIEDEIIVAHDLADMLSQWGYEVVGKVSTGEEAVEKAQAINPDMVLVDIKLEDKMDGIEAADRIRRNTGAAIVYLTARTESDLFEKAKKTEPYGFLTKPVAPQELLRTVEMARYKHEMEKRLRESEERYRRIVETANEGVWVMDSEFGTTFVNQRMAEMLGYSANEMLGRKVDSFMFQEDLGDHDSKMQVRRQGRAQIYDRRFRRKDGETLWTTVSATSLQDSEGNFAGSFAMFTDITERKQMEAVLREREGQLQAIFEASPAAIFLVNPDGCITFANQSMGTLFSRESEELLGTPYVALVHQDERSIGHTKMKSLMAGEIDHVSLERRYVASDGREFLGHLSGRRLQGPDGDLTGLVGIITDITDRRKDEDALRESEEHYKNFFGNALVGLFRTRLSDGMFIDINSKAAQDLRLPVEEIVGKVSSASLYRNPDQRKELLSKLKQDGEIHGFEAGLTLNDGSEAVFSISVKAYPDKDYMEGSVIDITDRKRAEEALRESEYRYRTLFERAGDGIIVVDVEGDQAGNIVSANQVAAEMHGYDMEEFLSLKMSELDTEEEEARMADLFRRVRQGETVKTEHYHRKKDGTVLPIELSAGLIEIAGHKYSLSINRDITERRKAEAKRLLLATALEQATESVEITDSDGMIVYVNPAFEKTTGYSRSEAVGKKPSILGSGRHDATFYRDMWDTISRGQPWTGNIISKSKDGKQFEEEVTISPVKDDSGKVVNYVAVRRDVTNELLLQKQLVEAQKMEAVGTLAGGIAHDFNNLLQVINGYTEMALFDIKEGDIGYSEFQEIKGAARSAAELTQSLLTFSRRVESKLRPLDLNRELQSVAKMLSRTLPKMIEIDIHLSEPLDMVNADPSQLQQVVMNLAVNARDAMPDGGKLVIETRNVFLDEEYCRSHLETKPGKYILLSVSDSGTGMDTRTRGHIFDPFFTTKKTGKGTGLGLSIVFGIVKSHGGTIGCYSEPGEGTTLKIYLPSFTADQEEKDVKETGRLPRGSETILLVDDEKSVRNLGETILKRFGYSVLTAKNGKEGVEVFLREREYVDLVILDLIMPEMGGRECLQEIMKLAPGARVIIASGYAANGQIDRAIGEGARASIQKPYETGKLLETVRGVLDDQDV
jgi:two-component system cell cycle sensor histidine kinase/response regulator CckA